MCKINHGCANGSAEHSDNTRCRTCLHNFHPSVVAYNSKHRCRLKIGEAPTMCLSQCVVETELHKENENLPRIVGSPEDMQHAHNYEMKIEHENNTCVIATVTPKKDSRNKK